MAMSAASMAAYIESHLATLDHTQTNSAATAETYRQLVLQAFCQGIIDEIVNNAVVTTTSGAPDGEHIGEID
jgi:hypothetical protein